MRKILIVGGGQSGLQLALCLQEHDYDVTLMTVRSSAELYGGRAVSMQILFDAARGAEREYGLNFWDEEARPLNGMRITGHTPDGATAFDWTGRLDAAAQSIDERVKIAVWQEVFEERGGKVLLHGATVSDLDRLALMFELTVVATGHSGLADMFPVDTGRALARMPPVATAIAYIEDAPDHHDHERIGVDIVPGLGHVIAWPGYSVNGTCRQLCVTGPADGPMARFPRRTTPDVHLTVMLGLIREYLPHRYPAYEGARLADDRAVAMDHANPLVREPIAHLPSGGSVLGMGDSVVVTSPALQQDANNACMAATIYLDAILAHGARPFDHDFMRAVFARYMAYAGPFTGELAERLHYTPADVLDFCAAAGRHQTLADRFANGFDDPGTLAAWFSDEAATRAAIAECEQSGAAAP
ncbi:2-polyprenyl-6-methoxyphenol hydroxylase-like FAD-dependent oxidoreductase [Murinocardiopsis flavida]|uniref:2-polyprenyl-6-methoxyphenol hydroxylase-like FAD-dependent oxidoreductase n=1 Tax=Murinocardiopsis flavida TaxID=645275 RepID=A0A2P8CSZ3_9ACTN|nr:styrene monooxygenase/indole monooxygenase family protein [Murinocardiopsis flavida]PSK88067.1 2-polyprenyl-6-methoxyphenol hydroxylase-like FAD-dependent oxidoreductase [Murinocardiopsis flavida]